MTLFTDITFAQVCLAVIAVAVAERTIMPYLPQTLVGPNGLLLKTS